MKYIPILIFLAMAVSLSAQSTFGWGFEIFPNMSNRRLIAFDNISQSEINRLEKEETYKPSYSAGLFAQWRSEKVGFQIGANYMDAGYRTIRLPIPADDPDAANATERRRVYQNLYVEAPVELHFFQKLDEKNEFFFMLGTGMSYNLGNNIRTILYNGETSDKTTVKDPNDDFRKTNFEFQAAMGWETALSDRTTLFIQPTFKFWMRGVLNSNDLNRNLYNLGVKAGLKFHAI